MGKFAENVLGRTDELKLLGEHADTSTSLASTYDDYFNGSDVIIEIANDPDSHLPNVTRFSVDITTGENAQEKLGYATQRFSQGKLSHVKYFESEYESETVNRGVDNIPNIVLSVNPEKIKTFLEESKPYVKPNGEITDPDLYKKKMEILATTYQRGILRNLATQIEFFLETAQTKKLFDENTVSEINTRIETILKTFDAEEAKNIPGFRRILKEISFNEVFQKVKSMEPLSEEGRYEEKKKFHESLTLLVSNALSVESSIKKKPS